MGKGQQVWIRTDSQMTHREQTTDRVSASMSPKGWDLTQQQRAADS